MNAMCLAASAQKPVLIQKDNPHPKPLQGEVLVRVYAAGVTPTELAWYPTSHRKNGDQRTGAVPSHEFSGEIAEIRGGVAGFPIGQAIYGMNDWFADGALAEYCVTQPDWIARKPRRLSHAKAGSVPIGALTAWQGLFDRAKFQAGTRDTRLADPDFVVGSGAWRHLHRSRKASKGMITITTKPLSPTLRHWP
jgi:NADPH:quinone reductase-like Zn-dependent oxidoreductase